MTKRDRLFPAGCRLAAGLAIAAATLAFTGCGGGGGDGNPVPPQPQACEREAVWDGTQCRAFALRSVERIGTPWIEGGRPLTLEMVVYRPLAAAPAVPPPAVVVHHGSTGDGSDPALFTITFESPALAREWVALGFAVMFPQRRGRGGSDGVYDEGFTATRSRYSCEQEPSLAGLEHALEDADVVAQHVLQRTDVDRTRLVVAGISRGGVLAAVHAARRPVVYRAVVNFVGGWLGEGCADAVVVNRAAFAAAGAGPAPSLWLYGENDPFYSLDHSRANFAAYTAAGGSGRFLAYRRSDAAASGHLVHQEPALWRDELRAFVEAQLTPAPRR